MGASVAKNTVENMISSQCNVANNSSTGIYTSLSNSISITVCADNGSNVVVDGNIDLSQFVQFNGKASLTSVSSAEVSQAMVQQAQQQADAIVQQFALGTASVAENVSKLAIEIATNVQNNIVQAINNNISNLASLTVCATNNSSIKYSGAISIKQGMSILTDYVIQSTIDSSASIQLQQIVSQAATAKMENFLGPFAIVAMVFVVVVGVVIFGGAKSITKPSFLITVTAVVIVGTLFYLGLAYALNWKPFKKAS